MGPKQLDEFLQTWNWPKEYADAKKLCDGGQVVSNTPASEWIGAFPIMRRFIVLAGQLDGIDPFRILSMLYLCMFVDVCLAACHGTVTADSLASHCRQSMEAHNKAWGNGLWKPKSHYCLHFSQQLLRRGFLLATFVHERKHRLIERMQTSRSNLKSFSKGCLRDVVGQQVFDMQYGIGQVYLPDARPANNEITVAIQKAFASGDPVSTARVCRIKSRSVAQGDVVIYELNGDGHMRVGKVLFFASVTDAVVHACMQAWIAKSIDFDSLSIECTVTEDRFLLEAECAHQAAIYSMSEGGAASALFPYMLLGLAKPTPIS